MGTRSAVFGWCNWHFILLICHALAPLCLLCSNKPSGWSWCSAPRLPRQRRRSSGRRLASCGVCWMRCGGLQMEARVCCLVMRATQCSGQILVCTQARSHTVVHHMLLALISVIAASSGCRPKAGALAGERDSLLQQLELERTAAEDARKEAS